ncbi:MAG: hypothetical protein JXX29_12750 [Deltaproteobacteria bacterium]|nr:hypothetical protein [Deltaproteobacteria bacterium]MBN2672545.1 hypothetical protein [Deltaproteobacteria bacterium]
MIHTVTFYKVVTLCALLLGIAACGESDDDSTPDTNSASNAGNNEPDPDTDSAVKGTGILSKPCQFGYAPARLDGKEFTYNELGLPTKQTYTSSGTSDDWTETTYTYDALYRLAEYRTTSSDNGYHYTIFYQYNDDFPFPARRIVEDSPTTSVVTFQEYAYEGTRLHTIVYGRGRLDSDVEVERHRITKFRYDENGRVTQESTFDFNPDISGTIETSNLPSAAELEAIELPQERHLYTYDADGHLLKATDFTPLVLESHIDESGYTRFTDYTWNQVSYTDYTWSNNRILNTYSYRGDDSDLPANEKEYDSTLAEYAFTADGRLESIRYTNNSTLIDEDGMAMVSPETHSEETFTFTDAGNSCFFEHFQNEGFYFPPLVTATLSLYGQGKSDLFTVSRD